MAVVALLATSANAALEEWYHGYDPDTGSEYGDSAAVKVDGKVSQEFRWPYEISYKSLTICNIPIVMEVGMYVHIKDCNKKKITLKQVDCGDISKGDTDYPCYLGCVDLKVRANFPVKLGTKLNKDSDIISGNNWSAWFDDDTLDDDSGSEQSVKLCVKAWKAEIYREKADDSVAIGSVDITVKPNY